MRNKLMALYASNRNRGFFRAEAGSDGKAVVYIYDMICSDDLEAEWFGGVSPGNFARELAAIDAPEMEIRVNSPGGSVWGGRAIAAAIREHPAKVTVVVDGIAASAASYLIQAADRIEMGEGTMIMIHNASTFAWGNAQDLEKTAALLSKVDGQIAETYAKAAEARGVEAPDFTTMMTAETWFTPAEAIAAGLADGESASPEKVTNGISWDLSAFGKRPGEPATKVAEQTAVTTTAPEPDNREEIEHRKRVAQAMALQAA